MSIVSGPDPSILEEAVGRLVSEGAEYAEARFHRLSFLNAFIMNGRVIGVSRENREGFAVRAIVKGGLGFASARGTSREALMEAASRALAAARSAALGVSKPIKMGPGRIGRARYEATPKRSFEAEALDAKLSRLVEAYKSLELEREGFKVASVTMNYIERVEEKILVTSDGAYVESRVPRLTVFYNIAATTGERRANRWFHIGGSGGLEALDLMDFEGNLKGDLESLYIALVKASPPPTGRMDVVLGPEVVGLAVHESAGHPSEADRILGREAAQAGMSFRTTYKEDVIGSEHATVVDDPTIPGSYGFYLYDDEGVAAGPRVIYERGRLAGMLHNRETAAVYGVESNAAARAMDFRSEPIVRMANTYLTPGDHTLEELIEGVKEGVYVKKYMEWNIDDVRWGQRYVGLEAYMIRNGRLAEPVRDVALEFTTREFYSSIDAKGRDLKFYAGMCGKGEPGQGVPVWFGGPHIRLRGVKVG